MNATRPDCARVVTPISAISKIIIGNMWNFLLLIKSSKISFIVLNLFILLIQNALNFIKNVIIYFHSDG